METWAGASAHTMQRFSGENLAATPRQLSVLNTPIDLTEVDCDAFILAGSTDHITPWQTCFMTSQVTAGRSEFVLALTGHVLALVNPPGQARARHRAGPVPRDLTPDEWLARSTEHQGHGGLDGRNGSPRAQERPHRPPAGSAPSAIPRSNPHPAATSGKPDATAALYRGQRQENPMLTRGAVLREVPGAYEVVDLEVDDPRQGEIRVRMVASGLCHSDDHHATGDMKVGKLPFAGGHEGAGVVEAIGPHTDGF